MKIKCVAFNDEEKLEFPWKLNQGTSVNSTGSEISGKIGKNGPLGSPLLRLSLPQSRGGFGALAAMAPLPPCGPLYLLCLITPSHQPFSNTPAVCSLPLRTSTESAQQTAMGCLD